MIDVYVRLFGVQVNVLGRQEPVHRTKERIPAIWIAALLAAGCLQVAPARAAQTSTIDSASPPLFVDCRGAATAGPTVILEAGAFGTSADWDYALDDLAAGGRVCAFDRAGLGQSPPRPGDKDAIAKAAEIGALLDQIGETRPVILVGHSNGALYVQTFAALWPARVAGLVYVNGVGVDDLGYPRLLADLRAERRASSLAVTAGRLGVAELVADTLSGPMRLRGEAAARKRQGLLALRDLKTARDEDRAMIPSLDEASRLGPVPPTIPTAAIISMPARPSALDRDWQSAESAPAQRADHRWVLVLPRGTHVSPLTRDRDYLTAAVNWLRSASLPDPDVGH